MDFFSALVENFRPLSGNYISQFIPYMSGTTRKKFPSPVGELHFSINVKELLKAAGFKISVPCRGTTFLNNGLNSTDKAFLISVPCRGTTFLNHECRNHGLYRSRKFPSPVGELHFSMIT